MDFDPSEFLAMAMSEDQNAVYTAPDIPDPPTSEVQMPTGTIVVEGGLQMEQDMEIPVPMFDMLQMENEEQFMETRDDTTEEIAGFVTNDEDDKIHVDVPEPGNSSSSQKSPVERTASPHVKKVIPATYEESRFRKDLYSGNFDRVKIFRLHCTICDKHLGCAPMFTQLNMRMHKLLNVIVCRKCFDFYGDINFPMEEGSELFCCWCGEGGELYCCSTCPKTLCKRCVKRNFGPSKIKEIDENDNWQCVVCQPEDIWPHRALYWGMQRYTRLMRQLYSLSTKEEKAVKLSKDNAHCCHKGDDVESAPNISLPRKPIMSKIPLCLVAPAYLKAVKNQPDPVDFPNQKLLQSQSVPPMVNGNGNHIVRPSFIQRPPPIVPPMLVQNQKQQPQVISPNLYAKQQILCRLNRPVPYPINHPMIPISHPAPPLCNQSPQNYRAVQRSTPMLYRNPPPLVYNGPCNSNEIIDVDQESQSRESVRPQAPREDIRWLEKGIGDIKKTLYPITKLLKQFDSGYMELIHDLSKVNSYTENLTHNIKIAICNLAKINQDIVEGQKASLDNSVTTVINSIQLKSGLSGSTTFSRLLSVPNEPSVSTPVNSSDVPETPEKDQPKPLEPGTPSTGEYKADLAIAMFCETVLETEGKK